MILTPGKVLAKVPSASLVQTQSSAGNFNYIEPDDAALRELSAPIAAEHPDNPTAAGPSATNISGS